MLAAALAAAGIAAAAAQTSAIVWAPQLSPVALAGGARFGHAAAANDTHMIVAGGISASGAAQGIAVFRTGARAKERGGRAAPRDVGNRRRPRNLRRRRIRTPTRACHAW